MRLEECITRITNYLAKIDNHPRIVNVNNIKDLSKLKDHFNVGENSFLKVTDYSNKDQNPSIDKLLFDLDIENGNLFLTEFASYMKLNGEEELNRFLQQLLHSSFSNKLVIFCYQCEQNLDTQDKRFEGLIYKIQGEYTHLPKLIFVKDTDLLPSGSIISHGIDNVAMLIESKESEEIYVLTGKAKDSYESSLYTIVEESKPFEALCNKDRMTKMLNESMGNDEEWYYALKEFVRHKSWNSLVTKTFGNCRNLELVASNWKNFDNKKKWLYFIALKIYGSQNNWCLDKAVKEAKNKDELLRNVYRSILDIDHNDAQFWVKYNKRKALINSFGNDIREVNDYCQMVKSKGENLLYYITDNTKQEKELMFEHLDGFGNEDNYEEIIKLVKQVYPNLYSYLSPYWFENDLIDNYFQSYKYQKVVNKIFPDFKKIVEEQAQKREYNLLPPRSSKVEAINKDNSALFFVDAMGVEFLSFIMGKCNEYNMTAKSIICRCELPSLTKYNKEFTEVFEDELSILISGRKGIKDIDNLKHKGLDGSDYESTKLPIHLIKELEIIEEIIKKIDKDIDQGIYERAVVISDHGASRLAVINEHENKWEMATRGKHSGRCCPINEIDDKPDFATEENTFWVLANYDRFKGGRKSEVEVHGGASLEEVVIPIIEITRAVKDIEIIILTPKIKFSIREKNAEIKVFSKTKLSQVTVEVDGEKYKTETVDNQTFIVKMPGLRNAKTYNVKVYSDNNLLKDDLEFIAEKEGFAKRELF